MLISTLGNISLARLGISSSFFCKNRQPAWSLANENAYFPISSNANSSKSNTGFFISLFVFNSLLFISETSTFEMLNLLNSSYAPAQCFSLGIFFIGFDELLFLITLSMLHWLSFFSLLFLVSLKLKLW